MKNNNITALMTATLRFLLLVVLFASTNLRLVRGFVPSATSPLYRAPRRRRSSSSTHTVKTSSSDDNNNNNKSSSSSTTTMATSTKAIKESTMIIDRSTLLLLEHINLNVPSHQYVVPFYFDVLGCGLDPRKAANWQPDDNDDKESNKNKKKKTLWANCGGSQFHLPYGATAQCIPGQIGLWYENDAALEALKERVQTDLRTDNDKSTLSSTKNIKSCIQQFDIGQDDKSGTEYVRLVDRYNNVFYCRAKNAGDRERQSLARDWRQPIVTPMDTGTWGSEIVERFGREETECKGIAYVEFHCPAGTADKIALFYESVLDATTSVVIDSTTNQRIAVIAFGNIDQDGRADQSMLFREMATAETTIPPYDGHHVAMYVGESAADFEQAFANAEMAGVVWVNPRFSDKTENLEGARKWKQFRFKDIVDMETGKKIFELEHEMRSVEHEAFPGRLTAG